MTPQQLEQALLNAHNAGDVEAARMLAAEIRRVRATQQSAEPPSGFVQGLRDPIDAGAQLLEKVLPQPVSDAINKANNWLADRTGIVQRLDERGLQGQLDDNEKAYQAGRAEEGESGFDWTRLAGNVVSPANLALAARGPTVVQNAVARFGPRAVNAFRPGSAASNIAVGGAMGATASPVIGGADFLEQKAKQTAGGAAGGFLSPYLASGAARVIDPVTRSTTKALRNAGIPLTTGQQMGGMPRRFEEMMKSSPYVGKAIENRQQEAIQAFNDAVLDRVLKPIGKSLPAPLRRDTPQALGYARRQISDFYDNVLTSSKGVLDDDYLRELASLRAGMAENGIDRKLLQRFDAFVKSKIENRATTSGRMNGDNLKMVEESLRDEAAKFKNAGDPFVRELGDAYAEMGNIWRRMVERNNPQYADKLKAANRAYAEMKQAQRAMSSVTNDTESFTPAQYYSAIKAMDRSKDKRAFAEGKALNQDFGKAAKQTMGNIPPNSNTAERLNWTNATGLLATLPTAAVWPMYTKPGQAVVNSLINQRFSDPAAKAIAEVVRRNGNIFAMPGLANLGSQGLLTL